MKFSLVLLFLMTACSDPMVSSVPSEVQHPEITPCRHGVAQAPAPPLPRTIDSIVEAYNKAKSAGIATGAALRDCAAKVDLLLNR